MVPYVMFILMIINLPCYVTLTLSWGYTEGTSTTSVIIIHQLEDKLRIHSQYLQFLSNLNLLNRVRKYTSKSPYDTVFPLMFKKYVEVYEIISTSVMKNLSLTA